MPLTETTHKKALAFLEVIKIGGKIMAESEIVDEKTKEAFKSHDIWNVKTINESITNKDLSSAGLKSLTDAYFTFWNESAGLDIEQFWNCLENNSFDFNRKDPLKYALEKGKFRNVHQGMSVRKDWDRLKNSNLLKNRLSQENIRQLDKIVKRDEHKRIELLKKCLAKKDIPQTQYLRFGDSMGYFGHCGLFEKYFTQSEYKELHELWGNFESK